MYARMIMDVGFCLEKKDSLSGKNYMRIIEDFFVI